MEDKGFPLDLIKKEDIHYSYSTDRWNLSVIMKDDKNYQYNFEYRFGGTSEKLLDIIKTYLTNIDISNAEIIAAREFFKKAFNVPSYSIEDGEAVCKAFKDIVMKQV